jgi:methylmalonyl-CoA mutase
VRDVRGARGARVGEQFAAAGTPVVCVCSSDKVYAAVATDAVEVLRAAGARQIWLAGKAEVDGIDGNLYAGCDALDVLRRALTESGVAE